MALTIKSGNVITTNTSIPGRARDWRSISVEIADDTSINITGVTGLRYGEKQDTRLNYGIGVMPVSKGHGNVEVFGEITMALYQLEDILKAVQGLAVGTNRPQNIAPFNLVIKWDSDTGDVVKDTLYQCTIDNFEKSINQNDMDISVTINLNPIGIEWNEQVS